MTKLIMVLFALTVLAIPPFNTPWVAVLSYAVMCVVGIIKLALDDIYAATDSDNVLQVEALKQRFDDRRNGLIKEDE